MTAERRGIQETGPGWGFRFWLLFSCVLALSAVVCLGYALAQGVVFPGDGELLAAWQRARTPAFDAVMVGVSYIGYFLPVFGPLVVVVTLVLWRWRGPGEGLFVGAWTVFAYVVSLGVKDIVRRTRPSGDDVWVHRLLSDFGYPSQHVVSFMVFFGLLCYLAATRWRGEPIRWPTLVICGLLMLLVGPSRVYLAAHWPTDVLGGYLLGYSLWAVAVLTEARFTPLLTSTEPGMAGEGEAKE